jgi:hypothetical protein
VVRRVEFIGNKMPYIILTSRWCNITLSNVHATCDGKDSFYEEQGRVFDQFPR